MAPKHWNKSHFLTILLRCRIATWSFIFLKTTEIYQKPALQWKYHHFQQKYFSAPAPFSQSAACFYCPFISLVQAGSQDAASSPGDCCQQGGQCLDACTASPGTPPAISGGTASLGVWSLHQRWPGDTRRVHGKTTARLLRGEKRDLRKERARSHKLLLLC